MAILCSRLKCGCMASALLDPHPTKKDINEFTLDEEKDGRIVAWEDRELVWAERCEQHEREYILTHPDYNPCQYCKKECKSLKAVVCNKYEPIPKKNY